MTGGVEAPNAAGYTGGLVPVSILRLRSVSLAGGLIARQHTAAAKRQPSLVDAVEERLLRPGSENLSKVSLHRFRRDRLHCAFLHSVFGPSSASKASFRSEVGPVGPGRRALPFLPPGVRLMFHVSAPGSSILKVIAAGGRPVAWLLAPPRTQAARQPGRKGGRSCPPQPDH